MAKIQLIFLCLCLAGCSTIWTRTVYVPDGKEVRLRQTVKNVKVWVEVANGDVAEGRLNLPEGWYCLPMQEGK